MIGYVVSIFVVLGLPPVAPVAWASVLAISTIGLAWAAALGVATGQPRANVISMVLEISIKGETTPRSNP